VDKADRDPREGEVAVTDSIRTVEVTVSGDDIVARLEEILREGCARRIAVRNEAGKTVLEITPAAGVVGALTMPQLAMLRASLLTRCTIAVEKAEADEA
jgi:hypothetical protein